MGKISTIFLSFPQKSTKTLIIILMRGVLFFFKFYLTREYLKGTFIVTCSFSTMELKALIFLISPKNTFII